MARFVQPSLKSFMAAREQQVCDTSQCSGQKLDLLTKLWQSKVTWPPQKMALFSAASLICIRGFGECHLQGEPFWLKTAKWRQKNCTLMGRQSIIMTILKYVSCYNVTPLSSLETAKPFFFTLLGAGKSKVKVMANLVPGKGPHPGS